MGTLLQAKIREANVLLSEAEQEESRGSVLAQQILQLTQESTSLLMSAKEKRSFGLSQLKVAEALTGETPSAAAEVVAEAAAAAAEAVPVKRRGRRPKIAAVPVAAAPAAAPPVSSKAPKTAKPVKGAKVKKIKAVRVSPDTGREPPLHERLKIVMGQDAVGIDEAITRLKAHNKLWVPKSTDLKAYISLVFSTHIGDGDLFDRVSRGIYQVKKASQKKAAASTAVKKTNGTQKAGQTGNGIEEFGSNVLDSPFAGDAAA